MLKFIYRLFSRNADELGNADAVLDAIYEHSFGNDYVGVLGEPDVVDRGGQYTTDLRVVIPFTTTDPTAPDPADLEYDLPEGIEDGASEFFEILERFGIEDLSDLAEIEGKNVPVDFYEGALVPLWEEVGGTTTDDE